MKKYEKYAEEIRNFGNEEDFCAKFVRPKILNETSCLRISCDRCRIMQMLWLLEEYEEPEVDWSKVKVDTPILVRENGDVIWRKRYFAKYENGIVHAWFSGGTSWSCRDEKNGTIPWKCAKLAEVDDGTN